MLTCPFCIIMCETDHIYTCDAKDKDLLNKRMLNYSDDDDTTVITKYIEFIVHTQDIFPFWWDLPQDTNLKVIEITKGQIVKKVYEILKQLNCQSIPIKIRQIQNKELYLKFHEITDYKSIEYYTHGSSSKNYENIMLQGFDGGYSNNGSYGYGIYTAHDANTSIGYNRNEILLCQVKITNDTIVAKGYCCVTTNDFEIYPEFLLNF